MPTYLARASAKQVEANRLNALKSTGPKSDEGRARSSQNSTRHGLCRRVVPGVNPAIAGEDPIAYEALLQALRADYRPTGEVEEVLIDRMAQITWKLRRVPNAEAELVRQLTEPHRVAHEKREFAKRKTPFVPPEPGTLLGETLCQKLDGAFERLQIYEQRLDRQLQGCLQQLRLLRKQRREEGDPRIGTNEHEWEETFGGEGTSSDFPPRSTGFQPVSDAIAHRSSGGSPVNSSSPSFDLNENKKEGRDEEAGETPELRGACATDTGRMPVLRGMAGATDIDETRVFQPDAPAAHLEFIRDDSRLFAANSPVPLEESVEQTNPISSQRVPIKGVEAGVPYNSADRPG